MSDIVATKVPSELALVVDDDPVQKPRKHYIDWLRVFLTCSVIVHHSIFIMVSGWWPIKTPLDQSYDMIALGLFILELNQSYFMGMFFFLSGLFVPKSYRKGPEKFLKDRSWRLLFPLPIYTLLFAPLLLEFAAAVFSPAPFWDVYEYYFTNEFRYYFDHLWFILLLFVFDAGYVCFKCAQLRYWPESGDLSLENPDPLQRPYPHSNLLKYGFTLAVITFVTRGVFPIGFWVPVLGQLAYLPQYIMAFVMGLYVDILRLPKALIWNFLPALIVFGIKYVIELLSLDQLAPFQGGFGEMQLIFTVFETTFIVLFAPALLVLFRDHVNQKPSTFGQQIIGACYAVYLIHSFIVIPITVGLLFLLPGLPGLRFSLCSILSIPLTWTLGIALKRIPGSDKVI